MKTAVGVGIQGRKSQRPFTPLTRSFQAIICNKHILLILINTHDHCLGALLVFVCLQNSCFTVQQENTVGGGWSTVIPCYWMNNEHEIKKNTTLTQLQLLDVPNLGSRFKWTRGTCNEHVVIDIVHYS